VAVGNVARAEVLSVRDSGLTSVALAARACDRRALFTRARRRQRVRRLRPLSHHQLSVVVAAVARRWIRLPSVFHLRQPVPRAARVRCRLSTVGVAVECRGRGGGCMGPSL
jgi:hypothetical protein